MNLSMASRACCPLQNCFARDGASNFTHPICSMLGAYTTYYGVACGVHHWAAFGGADRDRTGDLLLAKQALSQLSYSPAFTSRAAQHAAAPSRLVRAIRRLPFAHPQMVGLGRIELPTSPLSGVRSSQLSYRPESAVSNALLSRTG